MDSRLLFNVRLWPLARRGGRHFHLLVMAIQPGGGGGMSCTAEPPYFTASLYCCCTVTVWGGGGSWGLQQEGEALCFSKQWPCIDGGSHRGGCSTSSAVTFPVKSGQRFFGLVPTEAVILAAKASRCLSGKGEGGHQTYSLPSHC